jgi:hypothetical protein
MSSLALRRQLVCQFLGESLVVSFISLVFAVVIVELFLSFSDTSLGRHSTGIDGFRGSSSHIAVW